VDDISRVFGLLADHEAKLARSISLIPSENSLSPLARVPLVSDAYSRYFFDEHEAFGRWSFQGGSIIGAIQRDVLVPLLRRIGRAEHVDVRSVSGLTGMTLALSALGGDPGNTVLSVPVALGGHPDTQYVAAKLGYRAIDLPAADWGSIDQDKLAELVGEVEPSLVYVDHATSLFPIDITSLVDTIRGAERRHTHVHVDTSHVNGLVWGGVLPNPLECGADSYGGSTHKTFPGPHKAVLLTNDADTAERLKMTGLNTISHHHMSDVISLAVALVEFDTCGGEQYARQTVANARAFAEALHTLGFAVQAADRGYTATHQTWFDAQGDTYAVGDALFRANVVVNPFDPLPSLGGPGIRTGLNELTRYGGTKDTVRELARLMGRVVIDREPPGRVAKDVAELRAGLSPAYCFDDEVFAKFFGALVEARSSRRGDALRDFLFP
jgi:glycine/serine hydroxymethyltransferase